MSGEALASEEVVKMIATVRRVVTGPLPSGGTGVISDGQPGHVVVLDARSGLGRTDVWASGRMPYDNSDPRDPTDDWPDDRFGPLPNGTSFFVMQIPPDDWARAAAPHRTDTLDYIVILRGEVFAVFETSEVLLRAGDLLVQRGTSHAWSNRSGEPCLFAAIMIDARPA